MLVYDGMYPFAPVLDPSLFRVRFVQRARCVDVEFVEMAVRPSECVLDEAVDEVEIVVRGDVYGSEDVSVSQAEVESVLCRLRRRELRDWRGKFAACWSIALRFRGARRWNRRIRWCAHGVVEWAKLESGLIWMLENEMEPLSFVITPLREREIALKPTRLNVDFNAASRAKNSRLPCTINCGGSRRNKQAIQKKASRGFPQFFHPDGHKQRRRCPAWVNNATTTKSDFMLKQRLPAIGARSKQWLVILGPGPLSLSQPPLMQ